MRLRNTLALSLLISSYSFFPAAASASHDQLECESRTKRVVALSAQTERATNYSYDSNPAVFDPHPLFDADFMVWGSRPRCLVARLTAMAQPQDNWILFQVRVDGEIMWGHMNSFNGILEPVVGDPDVSNGVGVPRMVAYDFVLPVESGLHHIEVVFAGCCSSNPNGSGAAVKSANLVLTY